VAFGHSPLRCGFWPLPFTLDCTWNRSCCFLWGNWPALERHFHTCWKIQTTDTLINWISNEEKWSVLIWQSLNCKSVTACPN